MSNRGLEKILHRIEGKPEIRMINRYLALVADLPEEERAFKALDLAALLVEKDTHASMRIAHMVYRADPLNVRSLEIIIAGLRHLGRHAKAAVLANEKEKLESLVEDRGLQSNAALPRDSLIAMVRPEMGETGAVEVHHLAKGKRPSVKDQEEPAGVKTIKLADGLVKKSIPEVGKNPDAKGEALRPTFILGDDGSSDQSKKLEQDGRNAGEELFLDSNPGLSPLSFDLRGGNTGRAVDEKGREETPSTKPSQKGRASGDLPSFQRSQLNRDGDPSDVSEGEALQWPADDEDEGAVLSLTGLFEGDGTHADSELEENPATKASDPSAESSGYGADLAAKQADTRVADPSQNPEQGDLSVAGALFDYYWQQGLQNEAALLIEQTRALAKGQTWWAARQHLLEEHGVFVSNPWVNDADGAPSGDGARLSLRAGLADDLAALAARGGLQEPGATSLELAGAPAWQRQFVKERQRKLGARELQTWIDVTQREPLSNDQMWDLLSASLVWQDGGHRQVHAGVAQILESLSLTEITPAFLGLYLDALVAGGRGRHALWVARQKLLADPQWSWATVIGERVSMMLESFGMEPFEWKPELGVGALQKVLQQRPVPQYSLLAAGI